ncbi:MAG: hypothetical protein ACK4G1_03470 [Ignavibacteria bacterium]
MNKFLDLINKGLNMFKPEQIITNITNDNHNETAEYETQGFRDAARADGSPDAYKNSINYFYTQILLKQKEDEEKIKKKNFEVENSIKEAQQKKSVFENELKKLRHQDLPNAESELKDAEEKILQFIRNPKDFVREEKDNFLQWIYGLLTLALAIFIYFFYTSVVYSAIFRDVTISKFTIYNSIFYPRAIEEAYQKGFAALMITLLAPFVFYALGMVLDNIKKKTAGKNFREKLPYYLGMIFAFLLDSLFAYHISERIYNSKVINTYENLKPYSLGDAIFDLNFWIIIALGFCVYLLFGYLFSLYNELRTNSSFYAKVKSQLETNKNQAQERINSLKLKITSLENSINELDLKIAALKEEFNKVYYSPIEIKNILSIYTRGWINFLKQGRYPETFINSITNELNDFYEEIGVEQE